MKQFAAYVCIAMAMLASAALGGGPEAKLELKDGDRVAFIGNTFIEREQKDCYIETMLTSRFPDRNITFRNLGYSADTVTGSARGLCTGWASFEAPDKAFERLRKLVAEYKPTVLLTNYGMTESFSGLEGIPQFTANYNKMLDALIAAAGTSPRLILMSPNYHEDLGKPLPDPAEHNKDLKIYSDAIAGVAKERNGIFLDLFYLTQQMTSVDPPRRLTSNGIHPTSDGYWNIALSLQFTTGKLPVFISELGADGRIIRSSDDAAFSDVKVADGKLTFTITQKHLHFPPHPGNSPQASHDNETYGHHLKVSGLADGSYQLKADGQAMATASSKQWAMGVVIDQIGPEVDQAEALRKLIIAKNFDYFNYHRPDNDAYILAFRRGEQGRNAVEIPRFLPLVEAKEKQISELRVPKAVTYTLEAVK